MAASASIVHHVPGRVRLKVQGGKNGSALLNELKQSLLPVQGVRHVEANPVTGSLTIHYQPSAGKHFHDVLAEHGKSSGVYHLAPSEFGEAGLLYAEVTQSAQFLAAHSELARSVVESSKKLDNALKSATGNNLDFKVLVPLGLAIYSILEFGVEMATPLWLSLAMFSFNSFVALHPPLPYSEVESHKTGHASKSGAQ